MKTGIWLVRPSAMAVGRMLAEQLCAQWFGALPGTAEGAGAMEPFQRAFRTQDRWVLVMAAGIATRYLAGMPVSKHTDPAVVVVDEALRFAMPLLGGHEAGANALAYEIARATGAVPVISTATEALKPLTLGIGCRKGISAKAIQNTVEDALRDTTFSIAQIREAATVDKKGAEPGLREWLDHHAIPLRIFSTPQLAERPLTATPSPWVRRQLGLAGVCEPCALLASVRGKLLIPKQSLRGVSVAVVADDPMARPLAST